MEFYEEIEEYNDGRINYGELAEDKINNDSTKSYFKYLYTLDIHQEVKQKVEEKIISSYKRYYQIDNDVLCACVITCYQELNIPFDFLNIIRIFGLDPLKSKVTELLSKATTKATLMSEEPTSISVIIIKPSNYVIELFTIYLNNYNINSNNAYIGEKIKDLTESLEIHYPKIIQYGPRESASSIIYHYLKRTIKVKKRSYFCKKIFSSLPEIVQKRFELSCKFIETIFVDIESNHPDYLKQFYF